MHSLDLHGVEHDSVEFEIDRFVTNNFACLPVKVITGNSAHNIKKLREIAARYRLETYMEGWTNSGAYVIRAGELE